VDRSGDANDALFVGGKCRSTFATDLDGKVVSTSG
jgi:hypothetical protein